MSTVWSMLLFFITTLQQQRVRPSFYWSFPGLHKQGPDAYPRSSIFLGNAHTFLCAWFPKNKIAAPQSICKTFIHAAPQGSVTALHVERPSPDCQTYFATRDAQPSCATCGLPASASCPCCEDKFCHSHIYQCGECQISFCGDCLDLHSIEGHWSDSDTARAMVDSMLRRSSSSQPMHEQSSTRHTQRGFTSGEFASNRFTNSAFTSPSSPSSSCPAPVQRSSQSRSWRSTIHALLRRIHTRNYLAHSAHRLLSIFTPFSPEAAQ